MKNPLFLIKSFLIGFALLLIPQLPSWEWIPGVFLSLLCFGFLVRMAWNPATTSSLLQGFLGGCAAYGGLLLFIQFIPISEWLCRPLLLPHSTEQADAIVTVAGGHTAQSRPTYGGLQRFLHAAHLLKENRAPLLVVSTSDISDPDGSRESVWVASFSHRLQLPPERVMVLKEGHNTITEARAVAKVLLPKNIRRILVVTHGPHILRTVKCFESQGFTVLPAPVNDADTLDSATGNNLMLFNYAMHEWIGNLVYWLRGDIAFPFSP